MTHKTLSLALFLFPGYHLGAWRLPDAIPEMDMSIEHLAHAAELAEAAKLDAIFFEDQAAVRRSNDILAGDTYGAANPRSIHFDPTMVLPALAMRTTRLGLAATSTTKFNDPYNLARRFSTLDHISGGRAGWNLVTSFNEDEAQNFGLDTHVQHADRYERASEFVDVVTGLWDSWNADAISRDKATGTYFDVDEMHFLNHEGAHFKVRGPLTTARSPQGRPVIFQAGSSEPGRDLAARTADVVFTLQSDIAKSRAFRDDIRARAAAYGRDPEIVKVLVGVTPIVGETDEQAHEFAAEMMSLIPDDLALSNLKPLAGGVDFRDFDPDQPVPELPASNAGKSHREAIMAVSRDQGLSVLETARYFAEGSYHKLIGSAATIADTMQQWRDADACLRTGRALRRPRARAQNRPQGHVTADVVFSERPAEAADRAVPGHWEGDLIIGTGRSAIGTIVERKSCSTLLVHLPRLEGYGEIPPVKNGPALGGYGAIAMNAALMASLTKLPEQLRKTLTRDRGKELSAHAEFALETGTKVFFADPHSPWQRPTNENTNGLLRQYFPKGTDLSRWSAEDLEAVALALNNRPRKGLDWKTPAEVFDEQLRSLPQPGVATTG